MIAPPRRFIHSGSLLKSLLPFTLSSPKFPSHFSLSDGGAAASERRHDAAAAVVRLRCHPSAATDTGRGAAVGVCTHYSGCAITRPCGGG
eukprot:scaffold75247_cov24-Tisochrysis_lutea.AAC.2